MYSIGIFDDTWGYSIPMTEGDLVPTLADAKAFVAYEVDELVRYLRSLKLTSLRVDYIKNDHYEVMVSWTILDEELVSTYVVSARKYANKRVA